MLLNAILPKTLWEEATRSAVYFLNRCCTRFLHLATPFTKLHGIIPNVSHLCTFGCTTYVFFPKIKRTKLDSKSLRTIFVGYDDQSKAFRCYDSVHKKIYISRNVRFDENFFGMLTSQQNDLLDEQMLQFLNQKEIKRRMIMMRMRNKSPLIQHLPPSQCQLKGTMQL